MNGSVQRHQAFAVVQHPAGPTTPRGREVVRDVAQTVGTHRQVGHALAHLNHALRVGR